MNRLRIALPLAFGSLFAAAAHAQNAGIAVNTPLGSGMSSANITRMACVDLDQNLTMDAVFLVGNTPYASLNPDYWRQYIQLFSSSYSFNDVCAAPGLGFDGSDAVACVGTSGLWLVSRLGPSAATPNALAAVQVDASTNLFAGCTRIVCDDIDGNGTRDLIGVTSDGTELRRASLVGSAWSTSTVSGTFSTPVTDIEIVDWDGTGHKDIAVLRLASTGSSSGRIEIRSFNTAMTSISSTFYWTMPGVGVAMTKTRHRGREHDQLALVYRYGSPELYWFTVCGAEAPILPGETKQHEAGFSIGPVSALELSSGHIMTYEEENEPTAPYDVVITHNLTPDQLLFANLSTSDPASPSFSGSPEFIGLLPVATFTSPFANFTSMAGVADFDGDGDGDVLIPSRPSNQLSLFRNGISFDESEFKLYFTGEGEIEEVESVEHGLYHNLLLNLSQSSKLFEACDRVIVMIYRQSVTGGIPGPLEETPVTHAVTNAWFDISSLGLEETTLLTLPIYESVTTTTNRYHILLRPMAYDSVNGVYTHAFPATKYVFTFDNGVMEVLIAGNEEYFETAGGESGGDIVTGIDMESFSPIAFDASEIESSWLAETDSQSVVGGGNGGQSSGGTSGTPKVGTKKGGTQTGGVVVVVIPDPFGTTTPPPRPNASTP